MNLLSFAKNLLFKINPHPSTSSSSFTCQSAIIIIHEDAQDVKEEVEKVNIIINMKNNNCNMIKYISTSEKIFKFEAYFDNYEIACIDIPIIF